MDIMEGSARASVRVRLRRPATNLMMRKTRRKRKGLPTMRRPPLTPGNIVAMDPRAKIASAKFHRLSYQILRA